MNMQQMIAQAQRMKRELEKAQAELEKQEFSITKGGAVTVTMLGSKEVKSISIDEDAFEKEGIKIVYFPYTHGISSTKINEALNTIRKHNLNDVK